MAYIRPMVVREKYYAPIEAEVQRLFDELIYKPLTTILMDHGPDEMLNAMRALVTAMEHGNIWYEDGQFKGKFSSATTKELRSIGARHNPASGSWSLNRDDLPVPLRLAQAEADSRYAALRRAMITTLDDMDIRQVDAKSDTVNRYGATIDQMEMDFRKTVTGVQAITIVPEITTTQREIIAKDWGQNLDLYIKGWAEENILKLREQIQQPILSGGRAEGLVKLLQDSYGASKAKAKFLARQETALLMSKFQETRYKAIGIDRYRWSTSHDERVRHDHKLLNGKVFSFDQPPVTDRRTGARNNPGQDFNCRCVAVPIVD